jgi:hypothetical protein
MWLGTASEIKPSGGEWKTAQFTSRGTAFTNRIDPKPMLKVLQPIPLIIPSPILFLKSNKQKHQKYEQRII